MHLQTHHLISAKSTPFHGRGKVLRVKSWCIRQCLQIITGSKSLLIQPPGAQVPKKKKGQGTQEPFLSSSPEEARASKGVQGDSSKYTDQRKPTDHHLPTESHSAHGRATQPLMKSPTSFGRPGLERETERGREENRIMIILLWNELVLVYPEAKPSVISSIKWGGRCPSSSRVVERKNTKVRQIVAPRFTNFMSL